MVPCELQRLRQKDKEGRQAIRDADHGAAHVLNTHESSGLSSQHWGWRDVRFTLSERWEKLELSLPEMYKKEVIPVKKEDKELFFSKLVFHVVCQPNR